MTLTLRRDVSTAPTDDGMVLLDERDGRYFQLNGTGALVVRLLLDGNGPEEAADAVATRFSVDRERAASDVDGLIGSLRAAGLVEP